MELDILVKIKDLNYKIVGIEKLNSNCVKNTSKLLDINVDNLAVLIQNRGELFELSFYNFVENNINKNFSLMTTENFIQYLNNTYSKYNHYLFFLNTNKIIINDLIKKELHIKGRSYYCLQSILKTICKISVIVQGRQVLRKYRIPNINQVLNSLNFNNTYLSEDENYNYRYLFNTILKTIYNNVILNTHIAVSNNQIQLFHTLIDGSIHIKSTNNYSGKTYGAIFKILSLVYSGVDIDDIVYVIDKSQRKRMIEHIWNSNLLYITGYIIKILPIENLVKNTYNYNYIFIDINNYNDYNMLDLFYDKYNSKNLIIINNEFLSNKIKNIKNVVIDDIDFTYDKPKFLDINMENIIVREDALYIIDSQLKADIKNMLRTKLNKENIVSIKKLNIDLLLGYEFYGIYIFVKSKEVILSHSLISEIYKRATNEIIIYS
jgi:hypothetical protein